ncbi:hypothetical protein BU15DRAFT_76088 [Melanogaster broomeanus]|nr:hypothetical protein BU15DRAFT_76088 [Melanogaster broomeanus]
MLESITSDLLWWTSTDKQDRDGCQAELALATIPKPPYDDARVANAASKSLDCVLPQNAALRGTSDEFGCEGSVVTEELELPESRGTRKGRTVVEVIAHDDNLGVKIVIMRDNLHNTSTFSAPSSSGSSSSSVTTLPSQPNSSEVPRKAAFCSRTQSKDFEAAFATLASSYGGLGIVARASSA